MNHSPYKRILPQADTALLFIHGICGSPRHFDFLLERVPEGISVWSLLLPGHGGSTGDFSRARMSQWQAAVGQALDELCQSHSRVLVVGHSMGTLLAMENAALYPGRIEAMFLLAVPLRIKFGFTAAKNALHTAFTSPEKDSCIQSAARQCTSVALSRNPLDYLGWLPRYLELFALAKRVRGLMPKLETGCAVYQSRGDELVSRRSLKLLPGAAMLDGSTHYYYSPADRLYLQNEFEKFIKKEEV